MKNLKLKNIFWIALALGAITIVVLSQTGNWGSKILWEFSNGGQWIFPLVTVAALIDSINPCAFSVLLITIAFLFSLNKPRQEILKIGGFYVLGLFLTYILIGVGILQALHLFNTPHFMAKVGAGFLVAWALINLVNEFWPSFPIKLKIPNAAHSKMAELMQTASLPAAFILGSLVGLCEFPCTGGPYLMILGLLHDTASRIKGFGYLIYYNVIFILPLAIALLLASHQTLLAKVDSWRKKETKSFKIWGSIAMILLAILMLSL